MQIQGQVINPVTVAQPDGSFSAPNMGRQGELLVSELHGKWYAGNYRGKVFVASSAVAGVTLPANASNLVSVFSLWNPAGSGVNAELVDMDVFILNATEVVAAVGLVYQAGVGSAIAVPGTLTKGTPVPGNLGGAATPGGNAVGFYSALTHVGTPSVLKFVSGIQATANGLYNPHTEFDGKLILGPGAILSVISTTVQTGAAAVSMTWAEFPI